MTTNVNEALAAIQDSFLSESLELKSKLQNNLRHIKELEYFLKRYANAEEDADEKIFSPFKGVGGEASANREIEVSREKEALELENRQLLKEIDILDERISNIKEVISVDPFLNRFVFLDMQEKERQRIARDLHDSSLQNMIHLIHSIELSSMFIDRDPQRAKLELKTIAQKIKAVIKEMRETIYDLRPMEFDDLGFQEAIQNMIDKQQKETDIFINLDMDKKITVKNDLIFSNIYRIIRECIANAIKHSSAKEINIKLYEDKNMFYIEVLDDGIGFNDSRRNGNQNHFGLQILEERVQFLKGDLKISSSDNAGTEVRIFIPTDSI
ncbi:MAG: sensor histidine kinase [Lachnospiraceae bacterium]|nr:sensor histidine kinase [Lachnospiraceae bacterium]